MINEDFKKVYWVFNRLDFKVIPSYYVGGVLPSNFLNSPKLVFLEEHDPEATLNQTNPKVLILFKAFDNGILNLAKSAKKRGIKIISVFDDWYLQNVERTQFNLPLSKISDLVVVKTNAAANEIKNHFNINSVVIADPVRFESKNIFNKKDNLIKLCWYGILDNHDTILNEIKNLDKLNFPFNLTIITNFVENLKQQIDNLKIQKQNIIFKNWHERSDSEILNTDAVLLPYPKDKKRLVKSSNRIIDSLNLGRFTIMSPVPQFEEFKNFVYYGDIIDGIEWFHANSNLALEKTVKGQKYVNNNYSIRAISNKWRNLIIKLV
tara:strand:- start:5680 stop:6642 length:963 start_codon:yes stop_codon:yes gene_type:complete